MANKKRTEKSYSAEDKALKWLTAQAVELHTTEEIIEHAIEVLLKHM